MTEQHTILSTEEAIRFAHQCEKLNDGETVHPEDFNEVAIGINRLIVSFMALWLDNESLRARVTALEYQEGYVAMDESLSTLRGQLDSPFPETQDT